MRQRLAKSDVDLIMDSGAFSAWSQGRSIVLSDYVRFIEACQHPQIHFVNLDTIPGAFGVKPSPLMVEESARQSWKNFRYLTRCGFDVIPVYHQGEDIKWLARILDTGCDWVGISPANDRTTGQRQLWLDQIFEFLCGGRGWPPVKLHAFGLTSIPLMIRYPWYSVDSTSWKITAGIGIIYVPQWIDGAYQYDVSPVSVLVSDVSNPKGASKHLNQFSSDQRDRVVRYVESLGLSMEQVSSSYSWRRRASLRYFARFVANHKPYAFESRKTHLFSHVCGGYVSESIVRPRQTRIYMGLDSGKACRDMVREEGVSFRIYSFFMAASMTVATVHQFLE